MSGWVNYPSYKRELYHQNSLLRFCGIIILEYLIKSMCPKSNYLCRKDTAEHWEICSVHCGILLMKSGRRKQSRDKRMWSSSYLFSSSSFWRLWSGLLIHTQIWKEVGEGTAAWAFQHISDVKRERKLRSSWIMCLTFWGVQNIILNRAIISVIIW